MSKKNKLSMISILKSLVTGGKSDLKNVIKDNPDITPDDIDNIRKLFKNGLKDIADLDKEFADL